MGQNGLFRLTGLLRSTALRPAPLLRPAALVVLLLASACEAGGPAESPTGDESAWSLSAEPLVVIGASEGEEPYLFQRVVDADLLPDGRVVVADGGIQVVRIFEPDGTFQREIGRAGEGPGEFQYLRSVSVLPPDTILAWDGRAQRLTTFLADGTVVETRSVAADEGYPEIFLGRFSDGDLGFGWIVQTRRDGDRVTPDPMKLARFGPGGEFETELARAEGIRRMSMGPVPFSPFLHAAIHAETLYFTDGLRPEIVAVDGTGATVDTLRTPSAGNEAEAAWSVLEAELETRDEQELLRRLEELPRTDSIPHVAELLVDDEGFLWAKRYEPLRDAQWLGGWAGARGGRWWVLDRRGTHVTTLSLHDDLIPLAISADRVVGVTRDELGVERVVVHELRR